MLQVNGVTKDYPLRRGVFGGSYGMLRAVDNISFEVADGTTFGLVGESGCGKSTLSRLILGLERPSAGHVTAAARDPSTLSPPELKRWRRDVQIITQDPAGALPARMRVARLLEEPWRIHRIMPDGGRARRVTQLLSSVGLGEVQARKFPHELSGGQRQRVVIARALALDPKFVVCDEPVSALDVSVQAQVLDLLRTLQQRLGLTYLFISHDLSVVRRMAERIGVMFAGTLVETGPAETLYVHPAHPYTRELLDAMPSIRRVGRHRVTPERAALLAGRTETGCPYHLRCPLAIARCITEQPLPRSVGPGRTAACHRAEDMLAATHPSVPEIAV